MKSHPRIYTQVQNVDKFRPFLKRTKQFGRIGWILCRSKKVDANRIEKLYNLDKNETFDFLFHETTQDCPLNLSTNWEFMDFEKLADSDTVLEYELDVDESSGDG